MKRVYVICAHVGGLTIPQEAFFNEDEASARLKYLRGNSLRDIDYSLQYVPLKDGEN